MLVSRWSVLPPLCHPGVSAQQWLGFLDRKRRKTHSAVLLGQQGLFTAISFELSQCNNTLLNKLLNTGSFLTVLLSSHVHPSHWRVLNGDIFSRLALQIKGHNELNKTGNIWAVSVKIKVFVVAVSVSKVSFKVADLCKSNKSLALYASRDNSLVLGAERYVSSDWPVWCQMSAPEYNQAIVIKCWVLLRIISCESTPEDSRWPVGSHWGYAKQRCVQNVCVCVAVKDEKLQ